MKKIKIILAQWSAFAAAIASNPPRFLTFLVRSIFDDQLALRAMGLVYTTLLSLIPLLAVSFSLAKAFDFHIRMEQILLNALTPLGDTGVDLARRTVSAVEKVDLKILGVVGFLLLLYKSISLIYKIETALNYIWQVEGPKNVIRRFGDYVLVLLIGPLLLLAAIGITFSLLSTPVVQWLLSIKFLGGLAYAAGKLIPYIIVIVVLTFIYIVLPDTKVRLGSAFLGGLFAGIAWEAAGWAFASFTMTSADYPAVYSGFAIPILFLVWLNLSWFILLMGARIAFYHQYPQLAGAETLDFLASRRMTDRLSLSIMFLIGYHFHHNREPWKADSLARRLGVAEQTTRDVLNRLEKKRLIVSSGDKISAFFPERDIRTIRLKEILEAGGPDAKTFARMEESLFSIPAVASLIRQLDDDLSRSVGDRTLEDLVLTAKSEQ